MQQSDLAEVLALVVPTGMLVAGTVPLLVVLRRPLLAAWARRIPVPPRVWNVLHFLAFYLLFIVLTAAVFSGMNAVGLFDRLYGADRFPAEPVKVEAWGAVVGGAAADRATLTAKSGEQLRMLWASLVAVPMLLTAVHGISTRLRGSVSAYRRRDFVADLLFGLSVAVPAVPLVLFVHFLTIHGHRALGGVPVDHPLTRLGAGSLWWETAVFWLSVCVLIPWIEELLFRGLLLRWATASFGGTALVFALAGLFAAAPGFEWNPSGGPIALVACVLLFTLVYRRFGRRSRRRTVGAVAATSALFAAAHATVWPSPIPLFVLGAILALTVVKTGRIASAVVVHGFFNSVSFLYLIRSGPLG